MSNKLSTKTLIGIFAILFFTVIYFFVFEGDKNERTFRTELVNIDTAKVDEIYLYPKSENHSEVYLKKEDKAWQVKLKNGKFASVPDSKINNLLSQLLTIKPKRLAARNEDKWKDFQVDSTGTRVKVFEKNENTLDIIFGKFSFQQPRSMSTFVRLSEDVDIYEVDGFLEMTFNQNSNSFRNNTIVNGSVNDWQRLTFVYPADSSFILEKKENKWFINNNEADSAATIQYLNKLARLAHSEFADDITKEKLPVPLYSLKIDKFDTSSILINGFEVGNKLLITTDQNDESIFIANQEFAKSIFVSPQKLLK